MSMGADTNLSGPAPRAGSGDGTARRPGEGVSAPLHDAGKPIRRRRRYAEWIGVPIIGLFVLIFVRDLFVNPNWKWHIVGEYLFNPLVLTGVAKTIGLTLLTAITGTLLGLTIAAMRLSRSWLFRWMAVIFVGFMRAIPALVLLLFIYFTSALFPNLGFYNPFTGEAIWLIPINDIITKFMAAWIGLTLLMGSHAAEIFRGGVISVPKGQSEAAKALGMPPFLAFREIVLPQAIRVSIPALANEIINLFKNTSLVSIIGFTELLTVVQAIYGRTYQTIPMLIVACIWYLVIVIISMQGQRLLEKRFGRGFGDGRIA
jgi:polar amino acid transport system permease protein